MLDVINAQLLELASPEGAEKALYFFKVGEGEYAQNDIFLGIRNPQLRELVKIYKAIPLEQIAILLSSPYHEERHLALMLMVYQYERTKSTEQRATFVKIYLDNTRYINNWDLVDGSCYKILGHYCQQNESTTLFHLSQSDSLWERRMSIVSTYYFIKCSEYDETFAIAKELLSDKQDLIHKAVGWMLKEVGKRNETLLTHFLDAHHQMMPRTALRYSIEKLNKEQRMQYMRKTA
jgi:3-methyladenine DNA glycosylase AlkD